LDLGGNRIRKVDTKFWKSIMPGENLGEIAGKWKFGSFFKEIASSSPKVKRYHLRTSLSYPRKYLTAQ
jgi:hypothetical protein